MKEEHKKKIGEIMAGMSCPKGFRCAKSGFKRLCAAKHSAIKGYLDCLDSDHVNCKFALPFGDGRLCECPLRMHLVKKLGK